MDLVKPFKLGWMGDGGMGERLIGAILSGCKTATSCPLADPEDAVFDVGDRLQLIDKHDKSRGVLLVTRVELRPFGKFDDDIAKALGLPLAELRHAAHFANGRELPAEEMMRVVHFEILPEGCEPQA